MNEISFRVDSSHYGNRLKRQLINILSWGLCTAFPPNISWRLISCEDGFIYEQNSFLFFYASEQVG
jgi:hypothetical protein